MQIVPIGVFHCSGKHPYDAARQGTVAVDSAGRIELDAGQNFEQALQDLEGFSHVWLLFDFHHNKAWKPLVQPPRGSRKVGVFASRAPYRPNNIGLTCVRLLSVAGRTVEVADHDLLDGTPILDIKPYLSYADSFPEATLGWLDEIEAPVWTVTFSDAALARVRWLDCSGIACMEAFLVQQLSDEPFNRKRKRLRQLGEREWEIAYRTWRAHFTADGERCALIVDDITTGYTAEDLAADHDPYEDKAVHRAFAIQFGAANLPVSVPPSPPEQF